MDQESLFRFSRLQDVGQWNLTPYGLVCACGYRILCTKRSRIILQLFYAEMTCISVPYAVICVTTPKGEKQGCPEPRQDAVRGERVCRHKILGGWLHYGNQIQLYRHRTQATGTGNRHDCWGKTRISVYADLCLQNRTAHAGVGAGVHIHIGANGHTPQTLRNLANIMASHEQLIADALKIDQGRISRSAIDTLVSSLHF